MNTMTAETEAQKSWGDLPCLDRTVREVVAALRFDMAHNRWELVAFRLARLQAAEQLYLLARYAPEIQAR